MTSCESDADTSLTPCVLVQPGVHRVEVVFTPVGSGAMWIDDSALCASTRSAQDRAG